MGLFDFMKKKDTKPERENQAKAVNPASLESYTIKVENDQIPFHDCGVNMDVKLLVRAEFIFKGIKPDVICMVDNCYGEALKTPLQRSTDRFPLMNLPRAQI